MPKFVINCRDDKELEMLERLLNMNPHLLHNHIEKVAKLNWEPPLGFDYLQFASFMNLLSTNINTYLGDDK